MEGSNRHSRAKVDGLNMFDALLLNQVEREGGGQDEFAKRHGFVGGTVTRWIKGVVSPFNAHHRNRIALQEALGYRMEALQKLGEVSVSEACEIVLDYVDREARKYQPPTEASETSSD